MKSSPEKNWPKISIIILTLNGGEDLKRCLASIKKQTYPKKKVEIVVVDDASEDNSQEVAKSYGARVYVSGKRDVYLSWAIALHKITGEFTYMIDQDIELHGRDFLQKMVYPMLKNENIVAAFTREGTPRNDQSWVTNFISYHPAQCDPLYEFITPSVENTFIKKEKEYILCKFVLGKVPPFGRMFYRVKYLKKTSNWKQKKVYDHDLVIKTIKAGYDLFAWVPQAGLYHNHAKNLKHLLKKRARNLHMHYFPSNKTTEYRWLDTSSKYQVMKLIFWVIYANLFFPALIRGMLRALKFRDLVLLIEPVITITTTDVILWNFLTNNVGRDIVMNAIRALTFRSNHSSLGAFGR